MIIDTSVLIALLKQEPEADTFVDSLTDSKSLLKLSAGSFLEAQTVMAHGNYDDPVGTLTAVMAEFDIAIVPVDAEQARIGGAAYRKFGKASRSKAKLNFGDCFAYALAKATGDPLLYKGNDFGHTDIEAAVPSS